MYKQSCPESQKMPWDTPALESQANLIYPIWALGTDHKTLEEQPMLLTIEGAIQPPINYFLSLCSIYIVYFISILLVTYKLKYKTC